MAVGASLREEQAEKELAREISRIPQEEYHADDEEDSLGETRVLTDIRRVGREPEEGKAEALKQTAAASDSRTAGNAQAGAEEDRTSESEAARREEAIARAYEEEEETVIEDWDLEPVENDSNHLMIEAEDPESGLSLALESLKKIHRELGTKNPVAKISAQNLNRRGIFSVADRLSGRDLIVERAADLDEFSVRDLSELMEADKSGMIVVLIDTPSRMERLHNENPDLADKFQYIGCRAQEKAEDPEEQEIKRRQAAAAAEAARRQAEYEAEQERKRLEEAAAAEENRRREEAEAARRREEERRLEAARLQAEREAEAERQRRIEEEERAKEQEFQDDYKEPAEEDYDARDFYEEDFQDDGARGRERGEHDSYQEDEYQDEEAYEDSWNNEEQESDGYSEEGDDREMDVEEFAQYACKYASEIDCSISGKSMLALYERAEMMEEDGVPLTRESAEDLIEEAADRAEKPSFGGFFSSKYDKDGLLILKEKHFFD